jgi:Fic family protein
MNTFFWLLSKEQDPFVRVVLVHFVFVFIHPYSDGNGRMARFLMNCMIAAAGYKWLVIKVDDRFRYMQALESASAKKNILPFASFVKELIQENERGE